MAERRNPPELRTHSAGLRLLIIAALALAFLAATFPGTVTPDSATQLNEAIAGRFTDWHPPIMAALWRLLLPVDHGPAAFLVIDVALYALGLWAFWDAVRGARGWRSLLPLIAGAHPLALALLGSVQKDIGLAVALFASAGVLVRQRSRQRPVGPAWGSIAALLLAYAVLVRWNGIFAAAPLVVFWLRPSWVRPLPVLAGAILLFCISIPAIQFVDNHLLGAARTHPEASLELFDLAGISHFSGERQLLPLPPHCYTPFFWDPLNAPRCGGQLERMIGTAPSEFSDNAARDLRRRWFAAIVQHPIAYVEHRLAHFNNSLYFLVAPAGRCAAAADYFDCSGPRSALITADFLKKNPIYWPCVWVAAGLWLLIRAGADPPVRALAWSGLLNAGGYLVVGVATDWRYHVWTILSVAMALALQFANHRDQRRTGELALVIGGVCVAGYGGRLLALLAS